MSIQILSKTIKPLKEAPIWSFRRYKTTTKCAVDDNPVCSAATLGKQQPCPSKVRRLEAKKELKKTNSMWENPECCKDPCPDYYPRFDELYYEMSDKFKRKYQQTWVSCPKLQIKPKKFCCDEDKLPPLERRAHATRPKTACPMGGSKICMDKRSQKCQRIKMPSCRAPRTPPKCKITRSISDCLKECAPYPSYSECLRNNQDPPDPVECQCLNHPMMCEVWSEMRMRMPAKH